MVYQDIAARAGFLLPRASTRVLRLVTLVTLGLVLAAPLTRADVSAPKPSVKSDINESSGSFSEVIPIQVPKFHGLEPKLALSYSSSGGNGFVGVGWSLAGHSFIERTSAYGGIATYGSGDTFQLDGETLIACTTFGGTHCPQHQTYQRIKFDAALNAGRGQWTIWDKNGTKSVYNPLYPVSGPDVFRWAIASRQDTHGNTVTYTYGCSGNCYPETITYNNATITFYREVRPDPFNFANGRSVDTTSHRLRSIGVKVGANHARAYKLTYQTSTSPATQRSLLNDVREYGNNVVIDANGVITSGTALPPVTASYQIAGGQHFGLQTWSAPSIGLSADSFNIVETGDFNGDGFTDTLTGRPGTSYWRLNLSNGNGSFTSDAWWFNGGAGGNYLGADEHNIVLTGDFNGDGKTDLATARPQMGLWRMYISSGSGFSAQDWPIIGGNGTNYLGFDAYNIVQVGDFNGDGLTDIATARPQMGLWRMYLSNGSGFGTQDWAFPGTNVLGFDAYNIVRSGDFNGDGLMDIATIRPDWSSWRMYLSTGSGFGAVDYPLIGTNGSTALGADPYNFVYTGDFNGDGLTDIATTRPGWTVWRMYLSQGAWGFSAVDWAMPSNPTFADSYNYFQVADFNGDGKTDIAISRPTWSVWAMYQSTGTGVTLKYRDSNNAAMGWDSHNYIVGGDFNGDGLPDIAYTRPGWTNWAMHTTTGPAPDLMTRIDNGLGGFTTVAYTPSTKWTNHYMPVGSISQTVSNVTVNDGRGTPTSADTTTYTYAGALWSKILRRPMGYYHNKATAADGSYVNTFHRQTEASPGVISQIDTYSSSGQLYHSVKKAYTESNPGVLPYTSLLAQEDTSEHDGYTAARSFSTSRKRYAYDTYGNLTTTYDDGYIDYNGDERTTFSWFYPNTTTYVVSAPAYVKVYNRVSSMSSSYLIGQTLYYYDNNINHYDPPTKGAVTKEGKWESGYPPADYASHHNTSYTYDSYGNAISTTDPMGRVTTTIYTDPATAAYPNVYPVKSCKDPAGLNHCTSTTWDVVLGLPLEVKDPNAAITKTGYDKFGRKTSSTDPANNVTEWWYFNLDTAGQVNNQGVQEIRWNDGTPNGLWSNTYLDGLGRTWRVIKEGLTNTTYSIQDTVYKDASSQAWKQSHWYLNGATPLYTVTEYDVLDRVLSVTHPDGSFVKNEYLHDSDPLFDGKPYVRTTAEEGQQTLTWKDAHDRVTKIQEIDGTQTYTTTIDYRTFVSGNNTISTTDANGNVTSVTRDSLGRKTKEVRAGGATWYYDYYKDGQVKTETDAKLQVTTFTYDVLGRPKTKEAGGQTTTWYYDEAAYGASIGRETRVVFPGGSKEQTYDSRGLVTINKTCVSAVCKALSSTYDGLGRQKVLTYPDGEAVTYVYDAAGRLYSVSGYVNAMQYNAANKLLSTVYANGTTNTFTYYPDREWLYTAKGALTSTGVVLYTATYTYDRSGRVIAMTQGTPIQKDTTYTYDQLDRLKTVSGAQTQNFTYNAIGNITYNSLVGNYTYGDAAHKHAVTQAGSNAYTYDANGSMLTGAGNTFTWDAENRVASITRAGVTTTLVYDEDEQRVKKTTAGVSTLYFSKLIETTGTTDLQYYYAGPILVAEKAVTATPTTTRYWYHADRLGSIRLMSDERSAGGVYTHVKTYDYKAFGASESSSGVAPNERGYTGHITDAETGLIYMGARYYDATLSRFISADSIIGHEDIPQDLNRYTYVNNNPINNTDPDGHCWGPAAGWMGVCISALVGGLAGGTAAAIEHKGALKEIAIAAAEGTLSGFIGGGVLKGLKAVLGSSKVGMSTENIRRVVALNSPLIYGTSLAGTRAGIDGARRDRAIKSSRELSAFVAGLTGASGRLFGVTLKTSHLGTYMDAIKHGAKYGEGVLKSIRGPAAKAFIAGLTARVAADREIVRRRQAIQKRKRDCVALSKSTKDCPGKHD